MRGATRADDRRLRENGRENYPRIAPVNRKPLPAGIPDVFLVDVAEACGLSLSAVSRIFSGERHPRMETAAGIAEFLNMPIGDFYEAIS